VEEVLDKAAAKVETAFPEQPEVEASVRLAIGRAYSGLGLYAKAEPHLRRALELRQRVLGADHPDTLLAMKQLGWAHLLQGHLGGGGALFRRGGEGASRALGEEHRPPLCLRQDLAYVWALVGRWPEAEAAYRRCLEADRRVLGPEDDETLRAMTNLAA